MQMIKQTWLTIMGCVALVVATSAVAVASVNWSLVSSVNTATPTTSVDDDDNAPGMVRCANLIYAQNKTSKCFSSEFLKELKKETGIRTSSKFSQVRVTSHEMYMYPFAVMSGENSFVMTDAERESLRNYLTRGGFLVASPGCSSQPWRMSFRKEIAKIFPKKKLIKIPMTHPIFKTIYDIKELKTSKRGQTTVFLEGLEIDGKIVLVFSPEGLNDTGRAGGNCCCCGGNEIQNARRINVNLLAYALTH